MEQLNNIYLLKNGFLYKGEKKGLDVINKEYIEGIDSKKRIIILEEEVYIEDVLIKKGEKIQDKVFNIIKDTYKGNNEFLFHYEKIDKEKCRIYAVRGGNRVNKIIFGAKKLEIIPVQLMLTREIGKKFKEKYYYFTRIHDKYYGIKAEKYSLDETIVAENINSILEVCRENIKRILDSRIKEEVEKLDSLSNYILLDRSSFSEI